MRWRAGAVVRSIPAAALLLAAGLALAAQGPARAQAAGEPVDVALVLAIDVSRSMSREELAIQRRGYAEAIASREVLQAIDYGPHGRIGLAIFEWAGDFHARELLPWTIIESEADAQAVAARLLEGESIGQSRTSISGALLRGMALLKTVPYQAERRVIDVSGDGPNNQGQPVTGLRDAAVDRGITINGLPLMTSDGFAQYFGISDLDEYYRRCVIGGPGAFVVPVHEWTEFPEAVRRKLVMEIGGLAPGSPDDPWHEPWRQREDGTRQPVVPAQFAAAEPYDCLVGEKMWRNRRDLFYDGGR
ncbi:DUF1194 domain-containing protein [Stappia indica]|uniref:VWFA domain-containing protein n=1 Tax=Stappia indica TaxID=538381 RepID=A0A285RWE9_9HYPH|nr:DUF1194 domain-containing protein [Stappia indica]SOB96577.1 Protein of unknown function [Stappia indica]